MQAFKPLRSARSAALLLLIAVATAPAPRALALPPPFEAEYAIKSHGFDVGRMIMRLARSGDVIELQTHTRPTSLLKAFIGDATVTERSMLRDGAERLELIAYDFSSSVPDKERDLQGRWDSDPGRLVVVDGQRRINLHIPADSLDRLGALLQVMQALGSGQQRGTLSVVDLDELKSITYRVIDEQPVNTGIGARESIRVRRVDPGSNWINETWHAPALAFVPVKLEQRKKKGGKPTRLVLRSLRWLDETP